MQAPNNNAAARGRVLRRSISLLLNVQDVSLKHDVLQFLVAKALRYWARRK